MSGRASAAQPEAEAAAPESPEIEKVVEERTGYLVVDKFGEAEDIAEHA